jgi:hypothetical protein
MALDFSTMPPATGVDPAAETDEQRRQRLARTMPPAISAQPRSAPSTPATAAPPTAAPSERSAALSKPLEGRDKELALGATSQPTLPPAHVMEKPAAPDLNAMPPLPGYGEGLKVTPGQPAKPASFGEASAPAPDRNVMPPVNIGPAQQRFQELTEKGPPQPKWWQRALEVAGSLAPFGLAVEKQLPFTPIGYQAALRAAKGGAEGEQTVAKGEREAQAAPAEAELHRRNVESEISSRGNKDEAALAKIGMKRGPDGEIVPDENSEIHKAQQAKITQAEETQKSIGALRQAQTELAQARTEVENAKNDPNSPAYKAAQQKLQMAQRAHDIAAQNLGLHQAEFANKVQEQELIKPSGQSQSRGSAAQTVLNLYDRPGKPGLETLVRKNASQMGPLIGRVNRGEMAIGDLPPDIGELVTAMESFYALQPAVHGFRNVEFVKDFKTAMGSLERDPESFIAGMKGLRPTLESVRDEGKTSHKRIVEGRDTAGGEGAKKWNAKTGKYE